MKWLSQHLERRPGVRAGASAAGVFVCGGYRFDIDARTVQVEGRTVKLRPLEFELALYLFRKPEALHPRHLIFEAVWERPVPEGSLRRVDVQIARLKKKLGLGHPGGWGLRCVRNVGYRLVRAA